MKKLLLLTFLSLLFSTSCKQIKKTEKFELGNRTFLLNDKPFVIRAAELHYPRIPQEYWLHRIQMCKAMGMNTICLYVFWNFHEQEINKFDFKEQKNIRKFCELAQKEGMYIILRPGPYVCAEWDMGGLPWWLLKKKDLKVRCKEDQFYMERMRLFLKQVGKELAPMQLNKGGNILMVQIENEYPSFGNDKKYMELVKQAVIKAGFDDVQLFTCAWSSNFEKGEVEDALCTLNFGAGSNVDEQFKILKKKKPHTPLMCSEYWSGWFDHWGSSHETRSVENLCGSMKDMLDRKISFSLYMAHGGTTFGQWSGANNPPYTPDCTSYDYDAPINESGNTTPKFFAVRKLLKNYLNEGEKITEIPELPNKARSYNPIQFNLVAPLFENLPTPNISTEIQPMENFNQGWGRILYRTKIKGASKSRILEIDEVKDWATIFINGTKIGTLDRRRAENKLIIPPTEGGTLDILIEATGRVNYGSYILDRKGITKNVLIKDNNNYTELKNWEIYNFPVDYNFQQNKNYQQATTQMPAWHKAYFEIKEIGDTYFDMSTWGKGMVWVNGHNIGRYWSCGPQQALYVPGCWLKKGKNEVIVFELKEITEAKIKPLDHPILDQLVLDKDLLHRKEGETLDLSKESPIKKGTFSKGNLWQTIPLGKTIKARYLCIEAINSFKNDNYASIAELYVQNKEGVNLSRDKWKIIYADSEEVLAANAGANCVFDLQESTFWHTAWSENKTTFPHQIVIDLGEIQTFSAIRYLPRPQKDYPGIIKDYKIYVKQTPFTIK